MGKTNLFLMKWDTTATKTNKSNSDNIDYGITSSVEIYNSSDIPKIMRGISIGFYNGKTEVFKIIPNDRDNTYDNYNNRLADRAATIFNLESKKCIIKEFDLYINDATDRKSVV